MSRDKQKKERNGRGEMIRIWDIFERKREIDI